MQGHLTSANTHRSYFSFLWISLPSFPRFKPQGSHKELNLLRYSLPVRLAIRYKIAT